MESIITNYVDELRLAKTGLFDKSMKIYKQIMNDPSLTLEGKAHVFGIALSENREHFWETASLWLEKIYKKMDPSDAVNFERYIITNFTLYPNETIAAEFKGKMSLGDDIITGRIYTTNYRLIGIGTVKQSTSAEAKSIFLGSFSAMFTGIAVMTFGGKAAGIIDRASEYFLNRVFDNVTKNSPGFQVPHFNADNFKTKSFDGFEFKACIPYDDGIVRKEERILRPKVKVSIGRGKKESKEDYPRRCNGIVAAIQAAMKV
jgi:hypothetical protein